MEIVGFQTALKMSVLHDLDCHCGMPAIGRASKWWLIPNKRNRCELHASFEYKGDYTNEQHPGLYQSVA